MMRLHQATMISLLACLLLLAVAPGCIGRPEVAPTPQPGGGAGVPPSAAWSLGHLGATCTWAGGIALVAGVAIRVAAIVFPALSFAAPICGIIAALGSGTLLCGLAFQWLAGHLWILALAVVAGAAVAASFHWSHLRRDAGALAAQARRIVKSAGVSNKPALYDTSSEKDAAAVGRDTRVS